MRTEEEAVAMIDPVTLTHFFIRSLMLLLLRLLLLWVRASALLPVLLAVRLYSLLMTLLLGLIRAKKLFSFVLRPHLRILQA